jgi:integrase
MISSKKRGQHEGNIYRRADGRWEARLRVGYRNGKRSRRSVICKTRAEVSAKLRELIHAHEQGSLDAPVRLTVKQFLAQWLEESARPKLRPRTFATYAQVIRTHIEPSLGSIALRKLTPNHVQAWLNERMRAGLSPRTCQHARAILRASLTRAMKWGYVSRNVAALVDPPRVPRAEIKPLTPDQARQLLTAAGSHRFGALVTVALALGLRQGEALGLRWEDVDLEAGVLHVRHSLQYPKGGGWVLVEPKSERSRRTIALPQIVITALRAHRLRQNENRLLGGSAWRESGFVFTSRVGTPLDPWAVIKAFKRLLRDAGLPDIRFHDLRHTAATFLLAQGVDPRTIMETLGHSQISLTLNTYSHVLPSLQHDAAEKMNRLLVG